MFRKHNSISTDPRGDFRTDLEAAVAKARAAHIPTNEISRMIEDAATGIRMMTAVMTPADRSL
jgi:hypothetical protein